MRRHVVKLRDKYLVYAKWRKFSIGPGFHAGRGTSMWAKNYIEIGENFYFGAYSQIGCNTKIGDNVIFGSQVSLVGRYDHHYQQIGVPVRLADEIRDDRYNWRGLDLSVEIGSDVWVGHRAIVLSGVKISDGCIIAAGSIVTKDTESYQIYGGVPARKIVSRFESQADKEKHLDCMNLRKTQS